MVTWPRSPPPHHAQLNSSNIIELLCTFSYCYIIYKMKIINALFIITALMACVNAMPTNDKCDAPKPSGDPKQAEPSPTSLLYEYPYY